MLRRKFILLIVLITFFLFCHFVWANPEGQSLSYQIGPLLNKTIQTSVEKAELIKVIVVMNRDHLKPLSEDLINELKKRIERLGGHIGDHAFNNVQVWIPIDKVEELAKWGEIKLIRAPIRPQINSINSEGKDVVGATSWHNSGLTGKGVKIGVIDLGFSGYSFLLGSELPSDTQAFYTGSTSDFYSTEHGTACAEIAYDMSPDAELCLVNVGDYDVAFHNAVSRLKLQNVNVISSSMGINLKTYCVLLYEAQRTSLNYISSQINFLDNLKDQWDSTINSAINQGITWSQAAGNDGTKKWIGYFNDSDGDYWLNFTSYENYNEIELSNFEYGQEVYILMMWGSDSEGYTSDDYDLYITNNSGNIIDYSEIDQAKFPLGIETCKFIPLHGVRYFVRVLQYRATPQKISLLLGASQFPNFKHFTSGGTVSLFTPASNPNVITVGAVPYNNSYAIEPYSSQGPTVEGVIKPNLVAPDRVSTATYGYGGFAGTSAAAPHVAGTCALVKQAYPSWSPSQIKNYLEQNAQDLGESGKDNVYGSGLVQLPLNLPEPVCDSDHLSLCTTEENCQGAGGYWYYDGGGLFSTCHADPLASPAIPIPASSQSFTYSATTAPVLSADPSQAKPIGLGPVAEGGGTLSITVKTYQFSGPVDIYFGLYLPEIDPDNIYLLTSGGAFQRLSDGFAPWKANITGPINESLFGDILTSSLPKGTYCLYLLVTPTGNLSNYYLWITKFSVE